MFAIQQERLSEVLKLKLLITESKYGPDFSKAYNNYLKATMPWMEKDLKERQQVLAEEFYKYKKEQQDA